MGAAHTVCHTTATAPRQPMAALARGLGAACRISVARLRPAESDVRGMLSTRSKTVGAVRQVRGGAEAWRISGLTRFDRVSYLRAPTPRDSRSVPSDRAKCHSDRAVRPLRFSRRRPRRADHHRHPGSVGWRGPMHGGCRPNAWDSASSHRRM